MWISTNQQVDAIYPIQTYNYLLSSFVILGKSKTCPKCGKRKLPIPSKGMAIPTVCPHCEHSTTRPKKIETMGDFKRSNTFLRMDSLINEAFKNYYIYADFQSKSDYSDNWHHEQDHETYMKFGIVKDALEIKSCISALIQFDGMPKQYFVKDQKTYLELFKEICENDSIMRLEPYYDLLTMAASVIKAKQLTINPKIRGSRMTPANVTTISTQNPGAPPQT